MFSRATINLAPRAQVGNSTGVKFQLRFSFKSKFTTAMVMLGGEVAAKIGIAGEVAQPVEVAFGEGDDWGKIRLRRTGSGEVSNSLARPLNGKNKRTFFIPLGHQAIFSNQKFPASGCEWTLVGEADWIEITVPPSAMNFNKKSQGATRPSQIPTSDQRSRKEILAQIGKLTV